MLEPCKVTVNADLTGGAGDVQVATHYTLQRGWLTVLMNGLTTAGSCTLPTSSQRAPDSRYSGRFKLSSRRAILIDLSSLQKCVRRRLLVASYTHLCTDLYSS